MSEPLSPIGKSNGASSGGLPNAAHPLKSSTQKISSTTQDIMTQLRKLGNDDTGTPDDVDTAINVIARQINQLSNVPKSMESLFKSTAFKAVFPIVGSLYV